MANWCQSIPVWLRGSDAEIIAVDSQNSIPEEWTRSLPGLGLNTVIERAYIIKLSLSHTVWNRVLFNDKKAFFTQQEDPSYPSTALQVNLACVNSKQPAEFHD